MKSPGQKEEEERQPRMGKVNTVLEAGELMHNVG